MKLRKNTRTRFTLSYICNIIKNTKCCNNQEKQILPSSTTLSVVHMMLYLVSHTGSLHHPHPFPSLERYPSSCSRFYISTMFGGTVLSIEIYPGNTLVESLALDRSDLELQLRGRAGSVVALDAPLAICVCTRSRKSYRKCTSAPRGTTTDLSERGEEGEGVVRAEGNIDDSMVSESRDRVESSDLLPTALSTS